MHIHTLHLTNFRNYREETVELDPGMNLIGGDNGQGKTNLLEALHFACLGHSPRTRSDHELVRWGEADFSVRVEGQNRAGDSAVQAVTVSLEGGRRVKVDGREGGRLSDLLGNFGLLYLSQDDMNVVSGEPRRRRAFLDTLLCQLSPDYLRTLRRYNRVLKQRNAALRDDSGHFTDAFETLTKQLVEAGGSLVSERRMFLAEFAAETAARYADIAGVGEVAGMTYHSSCGAGDGQTPEQALKNKLVETAALERAIGSTQAGPHRDDLVVLLDDRPAAGHASQGQRRSLALALKLAASAALERGFRAPPILLLDDIFSELDEKRRGRLCELISRGSQVLLTSPRFLDIPFRVDRRLWVEKGRVQNAPIEGV